jgi:hypothetical protein
MKKDLFDAVLLLVALFATLFLAPIALICGVRLALHLCGLL